MRALSLIALLLVSLPGVSPAVPVKPTGKDRAISLREGLPTAVEIGAERKRFFGLGIGFSNRGTAQGIAIDPSGTMTGGSVRPGWRGATIGIALDQVVAGSPAERAGLIAGTVIAEINGESTAGRSGEDCTRMVREAGNSVVVKYYDPATLKLRTKTLEKDWFLLPN